MNIYSEVASHLLEQLSDIEDSNEFHNYGRSHLECVFDFLNCYPPMLSIACTKYIAAEVLHRLKN